MALLWDRSVGTDFLMSLEAEVPGQGAGRATHPLKVFGNLLALASPGFQQELDL